MFISVVIASYNEQLFIREALDSVLAQTHSDFELIIVDDGSTDGTLKILREYEARDERVCVLTQENRGPGPARNRAIAVARSDWIALMDGDDVMEPNRLERQIAFIKTHPNIDVSSSMVTFIDSDGDIIGRSRPELTTQQEVEESRIEGIVGLFNPAAVMRKSAATSIGGYRPQFRLGQDVDLWTRIADAGGRILVQPEYLLRYRVHANSSSYQNARKVSLTLKWLKVCSRQRRNGLPEPTFREYLQSRKVLPLHRQLNELRTDYSFAFYRRSVLAYCTHDHLRTIGYLVGAFVLGSPQVSQQIRWRVLRPVVGTISSLFGRRAAG